MAKRRPRSQNWMQPYVPVAEALVILLHPFGEVAIHDVATDSIAGIWGTLSGRRVGDESLLAEFPDLYGDDVLPPYEKVTIDGHHVTSVSVVIRAEDGSPAGVMCINIDRSAFDRLSEFLGEFLRPVAERPKVLFERDWREQIALAIDEFCRRESVDRHAMTKAQRLAIVGELDIAGLFAIRNAVNHVAQALGVSRASVYALLKEVRT